MKLIVGFGNPGDKHVNNRQNIGFKVIDIIANNANIEVKVKKKKNIFPGYILVKMVVTNESWYIVRNTPGVTGFVGTSTQPTPVSDQEITKIKKRMGVEDPKHNINFSEGEVVSIIDGPFKGFDGSVAEIDAVKGKIKVMVSMFGRDTSVELDALQVKKV